MCDVHYPSLAYAHSLHLTQTEKNMQIVAKKGLTLNQLQQKRFQLFILFFILKYVSNNILKVLGTY